MDWIEFQEGLIQEGYERLPIFTVETRRARSLSCPDCSKKVIRPRPFARSKHNREDYRLFMLCDWCGYYWEV